MSIRIDIGEWQGLEAIDDATLFLEIKRDGERAMKQALLEFEKIVKETLTGARSGRTYKISKTGRLHVASAPGEAPAQMFGKLRQSIGHEGPEWVGFTVIGQVGSGLGGGSPERAYARRLEFGGMDSRGVMIEARPYMGPARDKAEPIIDAIFRRRVGSQ